MAKTTRKYVDNEDFVNVFVDVYSRGYDASTKTSSGTVQEVADHFGLSLETTYQKALKLRKDLKELGSDLPTMRRTDEVRKPKRDLSKLAEIIAAKLAGELLASID